MQPVGGERIKVARNESELAHRVGVAQVALAVQEAQLAEEGEERHQVFGANGGRDTPQELRLLAQRNGRERRA